MPTNATVSGLRHSFPSWLHLVNALQFNTVEIEIFGLEIAVQVISESVYEVIFR